METYNISGQRQQPRGMILDWLCQFFDSRAIRDQAMDTHFRRLDPTSIKDIDKYLRQKGWMI